MKKKIILLLSFLMIAICLTGCSKYVIEGEKIQEITEIANNVISKKAYKLPEGYEVSFPDETTNSQIKIRDKTISQYKVLDVFFDVTKENVELDRIVINITEFNQVIGILAILVILVIIHIFRKIINRIKNNKKKS